LTQSALKIAPNVETVEFAIAHDWLTSRSFRFRAEPSGVLFSRAVVFETNGTISGYHHPNETAWRINADRLEILHLDGKPTCIFTGFRGDGMASLRGAFIPPDLPTHFSQITHILDENPGDGRPVISSFDLFDTLIARRCYEPLEVFSIVERRSGVSGFALRRRQVEAQLFGRRLYGLDDIYAQLAQEEGWTPQMTQVLRLMELAAEWDNIYPIRDVCALVRHRDIIISDMYLPLSFIREVVTKKCGLGENEIILSNYGKHLGVVWPRLLERYDILRHFGDNLHGDIASPMKSGVEGRHVTISSWSGAETILVELGLRPFALALREVRLTSFDVNPKLRAAQAAQVEFNLPFLLIASLYLIAKAKERQADTLLLCARDCNLLAPMLGAIARRGSSAPNVRYIAASRRLFYSGTPEYEAYFRGMMGRENLLVDIIGTGQSLSHMINSLGPIPRVAPVPLVGDHEIDSFGELKIVSMTRQPFAPFRIGLEALNTSQDGTALGCSFNGSGFNIIRARNEYTLQIQQSIAAMRTVAMTYVELLEKDTDWATPDQLDEPTLIKAAERLLSLLPNHSNAIAPIADEIMQNLRKAPVLAE
jgi:hypothetical protein